MNPLREWGEFDSLLEKLYSTHQKQLCKWTIAGLLPCCVYDLGSFQIWHTEHLDVETLFLGKSKSDGKDKHTKVKHRKAAWKSQQLWRRTQQTHNSLEEGTSHLPPPEGVDPGFRALWRSFAGQTLLRDMRIGNPAHSGTRRSQRTI